MLLANIHDFIANIKRFDQTITQESNSISGQNQLIQNQDSLLPFYNKIRLLAQQGQSEKKIGFYGQPDQNTINLFQSKGYSFIDLDVNMQSPDHKIVPEAYCHIIRDIVNNALYLKKDLDYIIGTTGPDKCDQGRNIRDLLSRLGFEVIDASNINIKIIREPIISQACTPLKARVIRIMELITNPLSDKEKKYYLANQCQPRFNYHGVPPYDIQLLDLFPDDTHIEGWVRLVEMGIPLRADQEWHIHHDVPTVFFAQSFCNKQMIAQCLAKENNGLYLDGHGHVTGSTKAKLEAFIKLRDRKNVPDHQQNKKDSEVHYAFV